MARVGVPAVALARPNLGGVASALPADNTRLYGYDLAEQGAPLELINVRVRSIGRTDKPALPRVETGGEDVSAAVKSHRRAYVPERGEFAEVPVLDGHLLVAGNRFAGPALVERIDTTVFVSDGYDAEVDGHGSILLRRRETG